MGGEVVVAGAGPGRLEVICLDWDSPASLVVVCQLEAREGDQVYREGDLVYSLASCRKESNSTAPDCPRYLLQRQGTSDLY